MHKHTRLPFFLRFQTRFHLKSENGYNYLMPHLAIFALGPLRIELDGQPIQTSRHKALALLVYLAMNRKHNPGRYYRHYYGLNMSKKRLMHTCDAPCGSLISLLGEGWLEANREEISLNFQSECLHGCV